MRSAPRNRVLIVGKVRELALYRAEVLRANGFFVSISYSEAEARAAIRNGGFDVVVLSYTLSNDVVEEVAELVRQHCPECRLVTISDTKYRDAKIEPDANVLADDGPKALLEALRETLRRG
jgi:DNA-binding NtrC family response regulator